MPNLVPHKSGVHRFACCVLYRRLLQHTSRLSHLEAPQIALVKAIINARFHRNARIQAFQRITSELELGYRTLRIFIALNKSQSAEPFTHLRDFISHQISIGALPESIRANREPSIQKPEHNGTEPPSLLPIAETESSLNAVETSLSRQPEKKCPSRRLSRTPNPYPVLSRPYPSVSGRRRIPRLISANGFPFLRIKKPQPAMLSRMIRCAVDRRNAIFARIQQFEDEMQLAATEDDWDALVAKELGEETEVLERPVWSLERRYGTEKGQSDWLLPLELERHNGGEESWTMEIERALWVENDRIHAMNLKRSETAKKMWAIVKAERALLEKERGEKRQARAERRRMRIGEFEKQNKEGRREEGFDG